MRQITRSLAVLAAVALASFAPRARAPLAAHARPMPFPIAFEPNRGQADAGVDFLSRAPGYTVLLKDGDATLVTSDTDGAHRVRMRVAGRHATAHGAGVDALPGRANYLIGSDPARWQTDVATYRKVRYDDVYDGVDLVYYGNSGQLEYDFVVAPGADPRAIALAIEGADVTTDAATGDLVLRADTGELRFRAPVVYQERDGTRQPIAARYRVAGAGRVGFELGAYDPTRTLTIDPSIVFKRPFGGSGAANGIFGIAVDALGTSWVTGFTTSRDLATAGPLQGAPGSDNGDAFVAKFDASGTLLYSTYLGGNDSDQGNGIAVDSSGNAYVVGNTASTNFPVTANAFQKARAGNVNAFVAKLNPVGNALVYCTYFGGNATDNGNAIALGSDGSAYITGSTQSSNFPTTQGVLQPAAPSRFSAFAARLNPDGSAPIFSTYIGGSSFEVGYGIAVDASGNAYVTGQTASSNFPITPGGFQAAVRGVDAFVMKINGAGTTRVYSTPLGGGGADQGNAITIDAGGRAYVAGFTASADFPTSANAYQKALKGSTDAFVARLSADGKTLERSTLVGSAADDTATSIALGFPARKTTASRVGKTDDTDFAPPVIFGGSTTGQATFPLLNSVEPCIPSTVCPGGACHSGVVGALDENFGNLLYSGCYGGRGDVYVQGIGVSGGSDILVGGRGIGITGYTSPLDPGPTEQGIIGAIGGAPIGCGYVPLVATSIAPVEGGVLTIPLIAAPTCPIPVERIEVPDWVRSVAVAPRTPTQLPPWLQKLFVDVKPNDTGKARTGTLVLGPAGPLFNLGQVVCTIRPVGGQLLVASLSESIPLTLTTSPGCQSNAFTSEPWMLISPSTLTGSGSYTITLHENTTTAERRGEVVVTGGTLQVVQQGAPRR